MRADCSRRMVTVGGLGWVEYVHGGSHLDGRRSMAGAVNAARRYFTACSHTSPRYLERLLLDDHRRKLYIAVHFNIRLSQNFRYTCAKFHRYFYAFHQRDAALSFARSCCSLFPPARATLRNCLFSLIINNSCFNA